MSDKLETKLNVSFEIREGEIATSSKQRKWVDAFSDAVFHIANAIGQTSLSMSSSPLECVNQSSCARSVGVSSKSPEILKALPAGTEIPSALLSSPIMSGNLIPVEIGCVYDWSLKENVTSSEPCEKGYTTSTYYRNPFQSGSTTPIRHICRNANCPDFSCVNSVKDTHACSLRPAPHVTYLDRNHLYRCLQLPKDNTIVKNTTVAKQYCGVSGFNQYMVQGFIPLSQHSTEQTEQYSYDPNMLVYEFHGLRPERTYHLVLTMHDDRQATDHKDKIPPYAPTGVTSTPESGNSIKVSWSPVDDQLDYYIVHYSPRYSTTHATKMVSPSIQSTIITNLSPGIEYQFRIAAVDWFGNQSDWSSYTYCTCDDTGVLTIGIPQTPRAGRGDDHVIVSWSAVSNAQKYHVYFRSPAGSGSWNYLGNTTQLNIRDDSLEYRDYTVIASNLSGSYSLPSTVVSNAPVNSIALPAQDITVAQDGTGDYTTLKAAIANAATGDVILVKGGNYRENITINKAVRVIGIHPHDVVLMPAISSTPVVQLGVANAEISNLRVEGNCTGTGIVADNGTRVGFTGPVGIRKFTVGAQVDGDDVTIYNCGIRSCQRGIHVLGSDFIGDNVSISGAHTGIYIDTDAQWSLIQNSNISWCRNGVSVGCGNGSSARVRGTLLSRNESGLLIPNVNSILLSQNNIFVRNTNGVIAQGSGLASVTNCDFDGCIYGTIGIGNSDITVIDSSFLECNTAAAGDGVSDVSIHNCNVYACKLDMHLSESQNVHYENPLYTGGDSMAFSYEPKVDSPLIGSGTALLGTISNIGFTGGWYGAHAFTSVPKFNRDVPDLGAYDTDECTNSEGSSGGHSGISEIEGGGSVGDTSTVNTERDGGICVKVSVSSVLDPSIGDDTDGITKKSLVLEDNLALPVSSPKRYSYNLDTCVFDGKDRCKKIATVEEVAEEGVYPHENWCSGGCRNTECSWYKRITEGGAIAVHIGRRSGPEARCCEMFLIEQRTERDIGYGEDHILPSEMDDVIPDNYIGLLTQTYDNLCTGGCWWKADFTPDNEFVHTGFIPVNEKAWTPSGTLGATTPNGDPVVVYQRLQSVFRSWKYNDAWYSANIDSFLQGSTLERFTASLDEMGQMMIVSAVRSGASILFYEWSGLWNSDQWKEPVQIPSANVSIDSTDTITSMSMIRTNVSGNWIFVVSYYRADNTACVFFAEKANGLWTRYTIENTTVPALDCSRTSAAICTYKENDGFAVLYALANDHKLKLAVRHGQHGVMQLTTLQNNPAKAFTACDITSWNMYELVCAYYEEGLGYTGPMIAKNFPSTGTWETEEIGDASYESYSLSLDSDGNLYATFVDPAADTRIHVYEFTDPMSFVVPTPTTRNLVMPAGDIHSYPIAVTGRNYGTMTNEKYRLFVTLYSLLGGSKIYMCKPGTMIPPNNEVALDWEVSDVLIDTSIDTHYVTIPASPMTSAIKCSMNGITAHPVEQFHRSLKDVCIGIYDVQGTCGILPSAVVSGITIAMAGENFVLELNSTNALAGEVYNVIVDWGNGSTPVTYQVTAPFIQQLPFSYGAAGEYTISVTVTAAKNSKVTSTGTRQMIVV